MTLATPPASARRRLPPLSTAATRIVQEANKEEPNLSVLSQLVQLDPALTVAVLRLVNSPFYGLARQVSTVGEANMVLGMATVRRVAVAAAVAQPVKQLGIKRALVDAVWCKAIGAAVLASRMLDGHPASAVAFTAGVLQDLGRFEFHLRSPEAYLRMESLCGEALCAAELAEFGVTHAQVGAELAEAWSLPASIVDAIAAHHNPPHQIPQEAAAQALWLASRVGDGADGLEALPPLEHIRVDPLTALASSSKEVEALHAALAA